ncbi:MAG: N-acetyl-gamma-glutamyl-phosphate reductase [Chloroflexi bacterium]|nr:N-acetyl-gamma-glutamyl-phosphate reductase [Chloroflexota bacterium]
MTKVRASIVGGSGYGGGELLRLLLGHPEIEIAQVTSETYAGQYVYSVHPNLRGRTGLKFNYLSSLETCDLLFLALPHGETQKRIRQFAELAPRLIDLSADFRLRDPAAYQQWYGEPHQAPDWLERFVYGLPEVSREQLPGARYISGVGCNATAATLALMPLVKSGLMNMDMPVIVDIKVGSSEGGNSPSLASHHPERSGAVRSFAPSGHRHTAEVEQSLGLKNVHLSVTSVELVRGVLATAHVWAARALEEKDLWKAYRQTYKDEPFVRIVKDKGGIYRYPEPKILAGSNYADVGFDLDPVHGRIVSICAIDNLMKGASGSAVQCMNLSYGWPESLGLEFTGLHPV